MGAYVTRDDDVDRGRDPYLCWCHVSGFVRPGSILAIYFARNAPHSLEHTCASHALCVGVLALNVTNCVPHSGQIDVLRQLNDINWFLRTLMYIILSLNFSCYLLRQLTPKPDFDKRCVVVYDHDLVVWIVSADTVIARAPRGYVCKTLHTT